jgi:hypothetical protein
MDGWMDGWMRVWKGATIETVNMPYVQRTHRCRPSLLWPIHPGIQFAEHGPDPHLPHGKVWRGDAAQQLRVEHALHRSLHPRPLLFNLPSHFPVVQAPQTPLPNAAGLLCHGFNEACQRLRARVAQCQVIGISQIVQGLVEECGEGGGGDGGPEVGLEVGVGLHAAVIVQVIDLWGK